MKNIKDFISKSPEILGGQVVFKGTRVPVQSLFWHLEKGISLDDFLEDFDTVSKMQAIAVLEIVSNDINQLYASAV